MLCYMLLLIAVGYSLIINALTHFLRQIKIGRNQIPYTIAVIVPARNEALQIGHLLDDLSRQAYPTYDVYVVDDRSIDNTSGILRHYQQRCQNLHLIRIDETPLGFAPKKFAIDTAIRQCHHDLIVTTDADCRVQPGWLTGIVSQFESEVGLVFGLVHFLPLRDDFLNLWQAFDYSILMSAAAATAQAGFPFAGAAANLAYRRQLYLDIGGYGDVAHRLSGDDVLLIQRIRRQTTMVIRFMADPQAVVTTHTEPTWPRFFRQRQRWASNSGIQWRLNKIFFFFLSGVFLINLVLVCLPAFFLIWFFQTETTTRAQDSFWVLISFLVIVLLKAVSEFHFLKTGLNLFKKQALAPFFWKWFLTHPLYVLVMGIVGPLGKVKWT